MNDAMTLNIIAGAVFAYIQEWMKNSKAPWLAWISAHTALVNRVMCLSFAVLTTFGIKTVFQGSMEAGGSLLITWPPLATMMALGEHALVQYISGAVYYHTVIKQGDGNGNQGAVKKEEATGSGAEVTGHGERAGAYVSRSAG